MHNAFGCCSWASQRDKSLIVTSASYFQGQLLGLGMGFEAEHEAGFPSEQVKVGTAMYLAVKGIWTFLGLGDVRKREKQQCTESLLLGKCLVRRGQSPLHLLMCCQCIVTDFGKLKKEITSKAMAVLLTWNLHFLSADLLDLFFLFCQKGVYFPHYVLWIPQISARIPAIARG